MNKSIDQTICLSQSSGKDLHQQFIEQLRRDLNNTGTSLRCTGEDSSSSTVTQSESFSPDECLRRDLEEKKKRIFGTFNN